MALIDEVKKRYSTRFLTDITNPDLKAPTTINDTKLTDASNDAESIFKRQANQDFDILKIDHISAIVPLVVFLLQERADQLEDEEEKRRARIMKDIEDLKLFTVRSATTPRSQIRREPTTESKPGRPGIPEFDRSRFDEQYPDPPGGA